MNLPNTKTIMQIHLIFAAFMFPIAMLFVFTGTIYYIFEYDGSYSESEYEIALNETITFEPETISSLVASELEQLGYPVPKNGWKDIVKLDKTPFKQFEWHDGIDRIIIVKPSREPSVGKLYIKNANFFKKMLMLHTANGNSYFKVYAVLFSTMLFCMFVTGNVIAWRIKHQRPLVVSASIFSIIIFLLLVAIQ